MSAKMGRMGVLVVALVLAVAVAARLSGLRLHETRAFSKSAPLPLP